VFFVFPVAFAVNRIGQHYNIKEDDPAGWTTWVRGHWFWDFLFLNSNYHLEHHYYPGIPFYNLPRLQQMLLPVYHRHELVPHSYPDLLYGYLVVNNTPHTDWDWV
jgi:fatty acid desaturase